MFNCERKKGSILFPPPPPPPVLLRPQLKIPRSRFLTKNNVRLAVNSGEKKNFFHRKAPASFSVECAESGEFL